jgi:hypothetical protein
MKTFKATITKIDQGKYSRTENIYYRIRFRLETGEFAMTDVVPTYRNFGYWEPVIKAGPGTTIGGVFLKDGFNKPLKVNADSQVFIIQASLIEEGPQFCCNSYKTFLVHAQDCPTLIKPPEHETQKLF